MRVNRSEPSNACGALVGFRNELLKGHIDLELDKHDIEMSILKQRILKRIKFGEVPSLIELTKAALEIIEKDLVELIHESHINVKKSNYVVVTGIQIHRDTEMYIYPSQFYSCINGKIENYSF
jgi:signal recognition particle GTPase